MPNPILFVLDDEVDSLHKVERELVRRYGGDYDVLTETSSSAALRRLRGARHRAKTVVLCPGIAYRKLGIDNIDRLVGTGVFYGTAVSEAQAMRGKRVYIVGAGNSAGQAALHLARYAADVTMLVRGGSMAASSVKASASRPRQPMTACSGFLISWAKAAVSCPVTLRR